MKKELLFAVALLFVTQIFAQTPGVSTFYEQTAGDNRQYIEYIPGNLPIIISAPHGGVKQSGQTIGGIFYPDNDSSLPDRGCGTNERDDNTEILVREIQAEIFALTGCYAHVIINNLHRSKLDPNREVNEATCGDSDAIDHWNGWHNFIDQASTSVEANWGKGLYIDLHGQSHSIARIELGYNISSSELNNSDLNAAGIINNSTIKSLVSNNINSLNHEQLVRGTESLGSKLKNTSATFYNNNVNPGCGVTSGYRAIPSNFDSGDSNSCDDTRPFSNSYFDGDFYNNRRHGSGPSAGDGTGGGGSIDGIMSEVNRRVRDLGTYNGDVYDSRPQTLVPFAKDYAAVLLDYIDTHYNDFAEFSYSSSSYNTSDVNPTPSIIGLNNGVFSSSAGLSINTSTGEINLSNSSDGNYTITYTVGSCGYYSATQTLQITSAQPDTTAPIITLNGNATINLNIGDIYNEQGATATDNIDGNLTSNIVIAGNVDTANTGTYIITYNVDDTAGNSAMEVSRTVNLSPAPDTTAPVIILNGNATINLNVGDNYNEQGANATDNIDGNLTSSIIIIGNVDTANTGTYIITYNVDDAAGNSAIEVSRTVNVSPVPDTTAPVITLIGPSTINLNVGDTYTEQGATATDNVDGNITANIVINGNVNTTTAGVYNVTYNVNDVVGNSATEVSRTININTPTDTTVPTAPTNLSANGTTETVTNLTWTTSTDNIGVTGYDVFQNGSLITSVTGTTHQVNGLTANTTYSFHVIAKDAAGNQSADSNIIDVTTQESPLNYCNSESTNNVSEEYISRVQLNNIDNTSGASSYTDFTSISTSLTKGSQYTITIIPIWSGTVYNEAYSVWIDYNHDGDFTDAGEQVWTQGSTQATSVSGSFTIPTTASESNTRMRVSMKYNAIPSSCESFRYGEVEDYTVIINSAAPDTTVPVISLIGSSTIDLNVGDTYNEQGATATDNVDGDLTSSIVIVSNVNTSIAGNYSVTYNVSDAAGNNATEINRIVNVSNPPDTTAPIITLIGSSTINLNVGDTYNEQGATAADNVDGDLTSSIAISGSVDTLNAGSYSITYNVSDAAGNNASEVTRIVNVSNPPDTTAPIITLIGNSTIDLNVGDTYNEQGATATDNVDGDLTSSITIVSNVNTSISGNYSVTYNVSDAAGNNATEVTRTVNVSNLPDTTAPIITLIGNSTIDLNVGDIYNEQGATATDNVDGDLTSSIAIVSNVNTSIAGNYSITYNVSDAAGNNATEVTRTVNVSNPPDTTAPIITLIGSSTIDLNVGDTYNEQGATATDNVDGDLTSSIAISGSVDTLNAGSYSITYNVSDAAGNNASEVTRIVNVSNPPDTTAPIITLIGNSTIDLNVGDTYNEQGATATDNIDGDLTSSITIVSNVNTSISGNYSITYNVSDAAGNNATEVTRTVNVSNLPDTTAPIITLIGSSTIDLNVGDTYNEQGATATDNIDGDLTSNIAIVSNVNTSIVGNYSVTYNVSDAAGNNATEVTRIINVLKINTGCTNGINTFPYSEGFENTLGSWTQSAADNIDWTLDANGTPSNNTGPSNASQGTYYAYVEASGSAGFPTKQAILNSPCFNLSSLSEATFSFKYHMYGSSDMGTFNLELSNDNGATWTSIWDKTGTQGNSWQTANIDLTAYVGGAIQLRFNRVTGGTWQADIAIDDISLIDEIIEVSSCSNGISSFPYLEDYENTLGGWSQSSTDNIDWTIDANGTPSNNTGPSNAAQGTYYIYVEASGNNIGYPNKQAIINSPCYDLTSQSSATFSFNYHMYGSNDMGTISLEASIDNGVSWTSVWNESGNKGNAWQNTSIDLSPYLGGSVQLRFNRITGSTWQADIAIDNIVFSTSSSAARGDTTESLITNNDDTLHSFSIYPNPVKGNILNIKMPSTQNETGITSFKIINMVGQVVHSGYFTKNIEVGNLPSGMYYVEVNSGEKTWNKKFIKE